MKTIEERAKEYEKIVGHSFCDKLEIKEVFSAGALSERTDLTRWNDPEECLPAPRVVVLLKLKNPYYSNIEKYAIGNRTISNDWEVSDDKIDLSLFEGTLKIIGWREIH